MEEAQQPHCPQTPFHSSCLTSLPSPHSAISSPQGFPAAQSQLPCWFPLSSLSILEVVYVLSTYYPYHHPTYLTVGSIKEETLLKARAPAPKIGPTIYYVLIMYKHIYLLCININSA